MIKFSLGWTLLHTLWQGAIIFGLAKITLSLISKQKSSLRYLINCLALLLITISCAFTFLMLNSSFDPSSIEAGNASLVYNFSQVPIGIKENALLWINFINTINNQMVWLIFGWLAGVLLFSARFIGGLLYIQQLKRNVIDVSVEWTQKVEALSSRIGLTRIAKLVESIHINKPIVLGHAKPIILLPIGILSGLPPAQIETILLHELAHIKRHDFLINLIQSIIEVLLFFNPFVWIISEMIRKEREHCCDDQVVSLGSSPIEYVKALAQLEEVHMNPTPTLALALFKNKYQVFNRIKRIMETSVNQHQGKLRPIVLLTLVAVALVCISWLNIGLKENLPEDPALKKQMAGSIAIVADTTEKKRKSKKKDKDKVKLEEQDKDKREQTSSYSRKIITTYDEAGTPHQEVIESFEGDEELMHPFSGSGSYSFTIPSIPSTPPIPPFPPFDMGFSYSFGSDTLPHHRFFSHDDEEKWEDFGREMEARFEHFGRDNEEFGRRMEVWADKLGNSFSFHFNEDFDEQMNKLHDRLEGLHNSEEFKYKLEQGLHGMEEHLERVQDKLKEHEFELRYIEENMEAYESALSDQLIKDGYLKKGDKVHSMNWGDGKLSVNGIKIKEEDMPKYEELNKMFFKGKRGFYIRD